MAAALPIPGRDLEAEVVGGKWLVRQRGYPENLAQAAGRRTWWQAHGRVTAENLLTPADLHALHPPSPTNTRTRLVVYDSAIDTLGHDREHQPRQHRAAVGAKVRTPAHRGRLVQRARALLRTIRNQ